MFLGKDNAGHKNMKSTTMVITRVHALNQKNKITDTTLTHMPIDIHISIFCIQQILPYTNFKY